MFAAAWRRVRQSNEQIIRRHRHGGGIGAASGIGVTSSSS